MKNFVLPYPNLSLKITDSTFSDHFKLMAELNGLNTLDELIPKLDLLPELNGSGMRMLKEAMEVLEAYGLGKLAED